MGNVKSEIHYSVPISDKIAGESRIYRNPLCDENLLTSPMAEVVTMQDAILRTLSRKIDRRCLGTRNSIGLISNKQENNALLGQNIAMPQEVSRQALELIGETENSQTGSYNNLNTLSKHLDDKETHPSMQTQKWYDLEKRIEQIHSSQTLSFTEKEQMISIEKKNYELNVNRKGTTSIKPKQGDFSWKSYTNLYNSVQNLANGMKYFSLAERIEDEDKRELHLIGIWSRSREEWITVDCANILYNQVTVPISESIHANDLATILEHTQISTIFCGLHELERLFRMIIANPAKYNSLNNSPFPGMVDPSIGMINQPLGTVNSTIGSVNKLAGISLSNLRNIVSFDENIPTPLQQFFVERVGINLLTLKVVIEKGASLPQIPLPKISPDNVASFSYTIREDNGKPLAAMLTHRNLVSFLAVLWNIQQVKPNCDDVYLSYLPLHHVYEKVSLLAALFAGASIGFYSGQISTLLDDMLVLRPTILCSVPSFYNKLYSTISDKYFFKSNILSRWVNEKALQSKLSAHKASPTADVSHTLYDNTLFKSIRDSLGGKLRIAFSSTAPLFPHVHQMLKLLYGIPIVQVYGCTQTTGPALMTSTLDSTEGHVGGPTLNTEFKIIDLIEMGYTTEDRDQNGQPIVRGELCLRGPSIFDGYFNEKELTKKEIDKNGWFHSGDIVQLNPNGSIQIIDSKKNIFKLQQGEYVCPQKLERIYQQSQSITDIFVYGSPYQRHLVAVVVPKKDFVDQFARQNALPSTSYAINCRNYYVQINILLELQRLARLQKLYPYEIIQRIHVELTPFSILGLISPNNLLKRQLASKYFNQPIQALYELV